MQTIDTVSSRPVSSRPVSAQEPIGALSHPTRDDRRVDLEHQVTLHYSQPEVPVTERTQNLSATGMFIKTHSLQPPGTAFDFELRLADGMKSIEGRSEVVWVRGQDDGLFRPSGMGVRFLDLDPADRQVIRWSVQRRTQELRKLLHLEALPTASRSDLQNLRMELEDDVDDATASARLGSAALAELRAEVDVALKEAFEGPPDGRSPDGRDAQQRPRRRQSDVHISPAPPIADVAPAPPVADASLASPQAASTGHRRGWVASALPLAAVASVCLLLSPVPRPLDATPQMTEAAPRSIVPSVVAPVVSREASDDELVSAPVRTVESDLEGLALAWAQAWSEQRARVYLTFYSPDFNPPNALGREAWERLREERILKPRHVRVEVRDLESEVLSMERGRVSFTQIYSSDRYRDTVRKTFDLVRAEHGWQILAERVDTAPTT